MISDYWKANQTAEKWEDVRCECTDCLSGSCLHTTNEKNRSFSIPKYGKRLCFVCQQHQIKKVVTNHMVPDETQEDKWRADIYIDSKGDNTQSES